MRVALLSCALVTMAAGMTAMAASGGAGGPEGPVAVSNPGYVGTATPTPPPAFYGLVLRQGLDSSRAREVWDSRPPTPTPTPTPLPKPTLIAQAPVKAAGPSFYWDGSCEYWRPLLSQYPWPIEEALSIIWHESRCDPDAWNTTGSGACGLWQTLPCAGLDPAVNTAAAYAKWLDGGHSFYTHWIRWWN